MPSQEPPGLDSGSELAGVPGVLEANLDVLAVLADAGVVGPGHDGLGSKVSR